MGVQPPWLFNQLKWHFFVGSHAVIRQWVFNLHGCSTSWNDRVQHGCGRFFQRIAFFSEFLCSQLFSGSDWFEREPLTEKQHFLRSDQQQRLVFLISYSQCLRSPCTLLAALAMVRPVGNVCVQPIIFWLWLNGTRTINRKQHFLRSSCSVHMLRQIPKKQSIMMSPTKCTRVGMYGQDGKTRSVDHRAI